MKLCCKYSVSDMEGLLNMQNDQLFHFFKAPTCILNVLKQ